MNDDIKIVWWNVNFFKFARNNKYVIKALEKHGEFDVICLQEYVEGGDSSLKNWLNNNNYHIQYIPFASQGKYSQGVMTAVKNNHGAIQSSHVLRKDEPIRRRPFPNIRGMISTTIAINGGELSIFNYHSTYPRKHTREMRKREFESIKKILSGEFQKKKWVLGGDFNFVGRDERRHYFTKKYSFHTGTLFKKTWRFLFDLSPIRANIDYVIWDTQQPTRI